MLVRLLTFILYFLKKFVSGLRIPIFQLLFIIIWKPWWSWTYFYSYCHQKLRMKWKIVAFTYTKQQQKISIKKQQNHKCFNVPSVVVLTYILLKNITVIHSTTLYHSHTPNIKKKTVSFLHFSFLHSYTLQIYLNKSVYNQNKNTKQQQTTISKWE